jgi:predicted lipoprotein with Yx(FWY)xxD motif
LAEQWNKSRVYFVYPGVTTHTERTDDMKTRLVSALGLALAAAFAGAAHAAPAAMMKGGMLVDTSGMTLYTFDKDSGGKSACNGPCVTLWPPAMAAADAKPEGDLTVITRDDGSKQWAYKGKPVYLYSMDKKPGDVTGDNFKDVWHVVK